MANTSAHSRSSSGLDTANVIAAQPGATLAEQDGVFTVTDGEGHELYVGSEVGAELAYWRTTFGVPVDGEGSL